MPDGIWMISKVVTIAVKGSITKWVRSEIEKHKNTVRSAILDRFHKKRQLALITYIERS